MLGMEYPQINMQKENPEAHQQLLAQVQQHLTSEVSDHEKMDIQIREQQMEDKHNAFNVRKFQ